MRFQPMMRARSAEWFQFKQLRNEEGKTQAELLIYDAIDPVWGIGADLIVAQLQKLKDTPLTVRLNSPGGDVFDGLAIYNALQAYPGEVTTRVEGLAASIASVIAQAGNTREIAPSAFLMIHQAWGVVIGNADEMRSLAGTLDKIDTTIVDVYARAANNLDSEEIFRMMAEETWIPGADAQEMGFADALVTPEGAQAQAKFDLSAFKNAPETLSVDADATIASEAAPEPTVDRERLRARLRLAGLDSQAPVGASS